MPISLLGTQAVPLLLATCRETITPAFLAQAAGPDEGNKTTALAASPAATVCLLA